MIKVQNIQKFYGTGESRCQVLKELNLTIPDGEFTVILGASGSGKSTFLNVLSGLEKPEAGKIFYGEQELTALKDQELTTFRRENIGFIFQQYYLLPNMNVEKNVKMGADLVGNSEYRNLIKAVGLR